MKKSLKFMLSYIVCFAVFSSIFAFNVNASIQTHTLPHGDGQISSWSSGTYFTSNNITIGRTIDYSYSEGSMRYTIIRGKNLTSVTRRMIQQVNVTNPNDGASLYSTSYSGDVAGNSWSAQNMPYASFDNYLRLSMRSSAVLYNSAGTTMGGQNSSVSHTDILQW